MVRVDAEHRIRTHIVAIVFAEQITLPDRMMGRIRSVS